MPEFLVTGVNVSATTIFGKIDLSTNEAKSRCPFYLEGICTKSSKGCDLDEKGFCSDGSPVITAKPGDNTAPLLK